MRCDKKLEKTLNVCLPTASFNNITEKCGEKASNNTNIARHTTGFTQKWVTSRGHITLTPSEFQNKGVSGAMKVAGGGGSRWWTMARVVKIRSEMAKKYCFSPKISHPERCVQSTRTILEAVGHCHFVIPHAKFGQAPI